MGLPKGRTFLLYLYDCFTEKAFYQQLVEHPYPDEIYSAKKIVVFGQSRDRGFLPSIHRLGTIDANPEAQVLVILAEYDFLIVSLDYQIIESAALESEWFHQGIAQFEKPFTGLGKLQNISSKIWSGESGSAGFILRETLSQ